MLLAEKQIFGSGFDGILVTLDTGSKIKVPGKIAGSDCGFFTYQSNATGNYSYINGIVDRFQPYFSVDDASKIKKVQNNSTGLKTIPDYAFFGNSYYISSTCYNIQEFSDKANSIEEIGRNAFYLNGLSYASFKKCKTIGANAFNVAGSTSKRLMKYASFPKCTTIGNGAFQYQTTLSNIFFPKCQVVGDQAFWNCHLLSRVSMPEAIELGSSAFVSCSSLLFADFPHVKTLNAYAFSSCINLSYASFPECDTITYSKVGPTNYASVFDTCNKLKTAYFPKLSCIPTYMFAACTSLTDVYAPLVETLEQDAFRYCTSLESIDFPLATTIQLRAFLSCSALSSATFPNVTSLGALVFAYCTNLTRLSLPKFSQCLSISVSYPLLSVFDYLSNLQQLYIDNSIYKSYDDGCGHPDCIIIEQSTSAFHMCLNVVEQLCRSDIVVVMPRAGRQGTTTDAPGVSALRLVDLPNCTTIQNNAFGMMPCLSIVRLPKIQTISALTFSSCSMLERVELFGDSVPTLASTAFRDMPDGCRFYVPGQLYADYASASTWKESSMFSRIVPLGESVVFTTTLNDQVGYFPKTSTLQYCSSQNPTYPYYVNFPSNAYSKLSMLSYISDVDDQHGLISTIGLYCFASCSNIKNVSFPAAQTISAWAFKTCTNLETVSCPACQSIGSNAFVGCSNLRSADFPECSELQSYAFSGCSNLATASFPKCTTIGNGAFSGCSSLISVYIPKATSIGPSSSNYVFAGCTSLETLVITDYSDASVQFRTMLGSVSNTVRNIIIDNGVYKNTVVGDISSTSIVFKISNSCIVWAQNSVSRIEDTQHNVLQLGSNAFNGNTQLTYVDFPACQTIETGVFANCANLSVAYFPAVTSVGNTVFRTCGNASIYFGGSQVPSLNSRGYATVFSTVETQKIYVKSSMLNQFLASAYWAYYSSKIFTF